MSYLVFNTEPNNIPYLKKERVLIDSRLQKIYLNTDNNEIVKKHWDDPNTFADVVLDIFNNERCYDSDFSNKENLTILDIGGNIGLFALYVQSRAKILYCLEPTPSHFLVLQEMVKKYENIKPLNIALAKSDSEVDFFVCPNNSTMNSMEYRGGTKLTVTGKKISTLLNDLNLDHVDFVKLDIEGSEMLAITKENLEEVKDKIDMWFIEVHDFNGIHISENRKKLADIFSSCDYHIELYKNDTIYARKPK